ncbi:hypothetical protein ACFTXJ_15340 [Streptomyces zhihengii]|uniref:hypothetical protein n=1 Tax=Streptomyces zhihengii TaxID=1818004 RepID=UPI0036325181
MAKPMELLALTGGSTVVAAMATDAWPVAREGTVRLFARRSEEQSAIVEVQLDSNAALVARSADAERVRAVLVPVWQLELESLLTDHPGLVDELGVLIARLESALPQAQQTWVQTGIAKDNAQLFQAMRGNVIVHQDEPGRSRARPETGPQE